MLLLSFYYLALIISLSLSFAVRLEFNIEAVWNFFFFFLENFFDLLG